MLFDHLVVGIGINVNKASLFDVDERVEMTRSVLSPFPNVSVQSFEGLTVHFVRKIGDGSYSADCGPCRTWSTSSA